MVFRERSVTAHAKGAKDRTQAAQLLAVLMEERPGDLGSAWEAVTKQGTGWVKRVASALAVTVDGHQEVFEKAVAFLC